MMYVTTDHPPDHWIVRVRLGSTPVNDTVYPKGLRWDFLKVWYAGLAMASGRWSTNPVMMTQLEFSDEKKMKAQVRLAKAAVLDVHVTPAILCVIREPMPLTFNSAASTFHL